MTERKQRAERREAMLDWQFPDEEAWLTEPTNAPAPRPVQMRQPGLTERNVVLLLILVCVTYWLWSAAENAEERRKSTLQQRMAQLSPTASAEAYSRTRVSDDQQHKQTTLVPSAVTLLTVIAEGQAHHSTPTSQQEYAANTRCRSPVGERLPTSLATATHSQSQ